jgi:NADH-ubiquinone oxidoreductase chain 3
MYSSILKLKQFIIYSDYSCTMFLLRSLVNPYFHDSVFYKLNLESPKKFSPVIQQAGLSPYILFLFLVPIIGILLLALNLLLSPHKPYNEKESSFECGFHSFLGQNRQQFNISFFLFGLLFLIFDLEIILIYPFTISTNHNSSYGLTVIFTFLIILTVGFCYEIGKKALNINSKQSNNIRTHSRSTLKSNYELIKSISKNINNISLK